MDNNPLNEIVGKNFLFVDVICRYSTARYILEFAILNKEVPVNEVQRKAIEYIILSALRKSKTYSTISENTECEVNLGKASLYLQDMVWKDGCYINYILPGKDFIALTTEQTKDLF